MKTIYKYDLQAEIEMPEGAQIIHFGDQGGMKRIWAIIDPAPAAAKETRRFVVHGTGHNVGPYEQYITTWFDGPYVWHLFEVVPA